MCKGFREINMVCTLAMLSAYQISIARILRVIEKVQLY